MFDAWEHRSDTANVKRLTGATLAAAAVIAGLAVGLVVFASRPADATSAKKVDVSFRPPPPPPEPVRVEPPPPPKPKAKPPPPVADAPPPAPAPMVAPKELPKEAAPEADAANAVAAKELAVFGTGDGRGAPEGGDGDESAAPVVASAGTRGPVNLPEDADPPEPDEDNEQPEYPESARAMGHEARVVLKIVIDATGRVGRVDVLKGEEPFTAVAVATVKRWKYEPARLDGAPIAVFKIVDLKFRLRSE